MNKYYLQNGSGLYFVAGRGFSASNKGDASQLTAAEIHSLRALGFYGTSVDATRNFTVNYVRPQDRTTYGGRAAVSSNANNPSSKVFASIGEAVNHASRNLESNGHVGFWVTETSKAVTHYVSVKEDPRGLTCPIENK